MGVVADGQADWQDGRLQVVVNGEGQYSVWPADRGPPSGWTRTGTIGSKAECLAAIADAWWDMRPASLRR
jgi:MbtH protein